MANNIDFGILINWIVSGAIGLVFGLIGGYLTYRLERNRDDIRWEREKLNLEKQFMHDREQMEIVWQQKLHELQIQFMREDQQKLRDSFITVLQNPESIIKNATWTSNLKNDLHSPDWKHVASTIILGIGIMMDTEVIEGKKVTDLINAELSDKTRKILEAHFEKLLLEGGTDDAPKELEPGNEEE